MPASDLPVEPSGAVDERRQDEPLSPSWLAAYAMGLVTAHREHDGFTELCGYVQSAPGSARAAIGHLATDATGDVELRARARRLLEAAEHQPAVVGPGRSGEARPT